MVFCFGLVSVRFDSVRFGSVRFGDVRCGAVSVLLVSICFVLFCFALFFFRLFRINLYLFRVVLVCIVLCFPCWRWHSRGTVARRASTMIFFWVVFSLVWLILSLVYMAYLKHLCVLCAHVLLQISNCCELDRSVLFRLPSRRIQVRIVRKKDTGIVWALKSMTKDAMVVKNQASGSNAVLVIPRG